MHEQEVIGLIRSRDERGAAELLLHYGPLMRYIIAPILSDPRDREECLSEIALRVWEKIGQFDRDRGSWTAWLTALTRNVALNLARKAAHPQGEELTENLTAPGPTPEEALLQKERQEALQKAVSLLPARDQALFYRKYYYLQSAAQIAAEMGMTERAVEGRLYRLKGRLRKTLGGDGYDLFGS